MSLPFSGFDGPGKVKATGYVIDQDVLSGIRTASMNTGVDFGYLMAQAAQESSFQPQAKAGTSSATGLYQFLDSTWLSMVYQHGAKHGLGDLARQIQPDGRGGYSVADPAVRREILDLRKDPRVSAVIGAEFALSNKETLEENLGHRVGSTELYLAHFLGAAGASRFLKAIEKNAAAPAAQLLPDAAAANPTVFYDRGTGRARTVSEIYGNFSKSIEKKRADFAGLANGAPVGYAGPPNISAASLSRGGTMGGIASAGDTSTGPTLSLLSILALAALDAEGALPDTASDRGDRGYAKSDGTALSMPAPGLARRKVDRSI